MSELADLMRAVVDVSHSGKPRGLSAPVAGLLRRAIERADEGDTAALFEQAPGVLRRMADFWQQSAADDRIADLEFELGAARLAVRHSPGELRAKLAETEGAGARAASLHERGLRRMGSGSRPTGAAVAGEAAAGSWDAQRRFRRALEIAEEAGLS